MRWGSSEHLDRCKTDSAMTWSLLPSGCSSPPMSLGGVDALRAPGPVQAASSTRLSAHNLSSVCCVPGTTLDTVGISEE